MTRRSVIKAGSTAALASGLSLSASPTQGRLKQSVARWCYKDMSLDDLCRNGAEMGLSGIDLLGHDDWPTVQKYGLVPAMGQPGAGTIPDAWNRVESHDRLVKEMQENIERAAAARVPNMNDVLQIERRYERGEIVSVNVHVISSTLLTGTPKPAPIVRNTAIPA